MKEKHLGCIDAVYTGFAVINRRTYFAMFPFVRGFIFASLHNLDGRGIHLLTNKKR